MLLHTRRLRLRPVVPDDLDRLVELDADPAVMRFVSGGPATSRQTIAEWVIPRMQAQYREYGTGMWIVSPDEAPADVLGWVQVRTPRHSDAGELELSYRLRRSAWGHGYVTEASHALITLMFSDTPATRIFAGTHVGHAASRAVMEKLGMRLAASTDVRALTSPDSVVEYELLRQHWLATRGRGTVRSGTRRARAS